MSTIDNNTVRANKSLIQRTKYQLTFNRIPDVSFFCQRVTLPGLQLNSTEQPTPFINRPVAGEKLIHENLDIVWLLEEDMVSWEEIHKWMTGIGLQTGYEDFNKLSTISRITTPNAINRNLSGGTQKLDVQKMIYSDATLTVLSTQNNPRLRFKFHDCFPIALDNIIFDSEANADEIVTCTSSFRFFYYEIERIPNG